jgi:hypothetical protein
MVGDWRKLHDEELCNLHSSPNVIIMIKSRAIRWTWYAACMEEKRNTHRILGVKPEWKTPLRRPRCRWKNNIKMDLRETG